MNTIPNKIKLKFLGGTKEVGRSGVAVKMGRNQILVDYGVMMSHHPGFPMHISPRDINGIVLSHSHLDHSGAIPLFFIVEKMPVFGTQPTFDLSKLLITDLLKLSGYFLPYEFIDLQSMCENCVNINYRSPYQFKDISIELFNAGHIPGSAQVLLNWKDKKILYTSDYNTTKTKLLEGADQDYPDLDALIMESTYASDDHPSRDEVERSFIKRAIEVVEDGGTVLVPAFAVGRSQEILCILASHNFEYPIYIDGMAKDANNIILQYLDKLRDPKLAFNALKKINWITGWSERRRVAKKPGVIVSPAGMLKGGNAIFYMNTVSKKKKNAIFVVSYQVPDTPGRQLIDTKRFLIGGRMRKVEAEIDHFHLTSHCGRSDLLSTVKRLKGNPKVIIMHGAEENCQSLAYEIETNIGLEATAPNTGDTITI